MRDDQKTVPCLTIACYMNRQKTVRKLSLEFSVATPRFELGTCRLCLLLQFSLPNCFVCSLDCLFTRSGCLPFSLYTFIISDAWLGITIVKASPNLTSYIQTVPGLEALKFANQIPTIPVFSECQGPLSSLASDQTNFTFVMSAFGKRDNEKHILFLNHSNYKVYLAN